MLWQKEKQCFGWYCSLLPCYGFANRHSTLLVLQLQTGSHYGKVLESREGYNNYLIKIKRNFWSRNFFIFYILSICLSEDFNNTNKQSSLSIERILFIKTYKHPKADLFDFIPYKLNYNLLFVDLVIGIINLFGVKTFWVKKIYKIQNKLIYVIFLSWV